jgi:hypothetical protein
MQGSRRSAGVAHLDLQKQLRRGQLVVEVERCRSGWATALIVFARPPLSCFYRPRRCVGGSVWESNSSFQILSLGG